MRRKSVNIYTEKSKEHDELTRDYSTLDNFEQDDEIEKNGKENQSKMKLNITDKMGVEKSEEITPAGDDEEVHKMDNSSLKRKGLEHFEAIDIKDVFRQRFQDEEGNIVSIRKFIFGHSASALIHC